MIISIRQALYNSLSDAEKSVVDFINDHESQIPSLSITNIAEKTFTSTATVSRSIQKCGFQGISELRYKIAQKDTQHKQDYSSYVMNSILDKTYQECTQTLNNVSIPAILKAIEYIKDAKRVFIYSRGFTSLIAEEFQMYLQLLGYDAVIVKDVMWMTNTKHIVTKDDAVFILSVRNSTRELAVSAQAAHQLGAKVITCCCKTPVNLEEYSDIVITGHSEIIIRTKGQVAYSRIPLSIITRTIIEYLSLELSNE